MVPGRDRRPGQGDALARQRRRAPRAPHQAAALAGRRWRALGGPHQALRWRGGAGAWLGDLKRALRERGGAGARPATRTRRCASGAAPAPDAGPRRAGERPGVPLPLDTSRCAARRAVPMRHAACGGERPRTIRPASGPAPQRLCCPHPARKGPGAAVSLCKALQRTRAHRAAQVGFLGHARRGPAGFMQDAAYARCISYRDGVGSGLRPCPGHMKCPAGWRACGRLCGKRVAPMHGCAGLACVS